MENEKTKEIKSLLSKTLDSYKQDPTQIAEFLAFQSKFYKYSFKNTFLIYKQNPHASFVASFLKWKELGYSVKGQEKGIQILVPYKKTYFRRNEKVVAVTEATAAEKAKIKTKEIPVQEKVWYGVGSVFDIAQTTCPVEEYPKLFFVGVESELHEKYYIKLKSYITSIGISVNESNFNSISLRGLYYPEQNEIKINKKLKDTEKLSVLTHEFGHDLLHNKASLLQPPAIIEFEADCFSITLANRLKVEITETRKKHLTEQYKKCHTEVDFDLESSLAAVMDKYKHMMSTFEPCLQEHNTKQPQIKLTKKRRLH